MSRLKKKQNRLAFTEALREIGFFAADILYNAVIIIALVILIRSFLISPFRVVGSSMADTLHSSEFILIDKLSYNIGMPKRGDPIVFRPPITNKYSYKFEESVITNEKGDGIFNFQNLTGVKNAVYCKNNIVKNLWFCKDKVNEGDIVYYYPTNSGFSLNKDIVEERKVSSDEIEKNRIMIKGLANNAYSIRVYDSSGPEFFVKRIIGIPGDTIKVDNGRVYLKASDKEDFSELNEDYLNAENKFHTYLNNTLTNNTLTNNTFTVPDGYYFTLGDNRTHSNDSRSWFTPILQESTPYVPISNISGRVLIVLWPFNNLRIIRNANL